MAPKPSTVRANDLEAALDSLAAPGRLKLLEFLSEPRSIRSLVAETGKSRPTVETTMEALLEAGLVRKGQSERKGRRIHTFSADAAALYEITSGLELFAWSLSRRAHVAVTETPVAPNLGVLASHDLPEIHVLRGPNPIRYSLMPGALEPAAIGRSSDCRVSLAYDRYVSDKHAAVHWNGNQFMLIDTASTNGTRHNWLQLRPRVPATLIHGDLISIGRSLLYFSWPQENGQFSRGVRDGASGRAGSA